MSTTTPIKDCFGKRFEAYPKCESCPRISDCSFDTLLKELDKEGYKVTTSEFGELIHVDRKKRQDRTKEYVDKRPFI